MTDSRLLGVFNNRNFESLNVFRVYLFYVDGGAYIYNLYIYAVMHNSHKISYM